MKQDQDKKIIIFTDGSSLGNPGPGGYGAVILLMPENKVIEIGGRENMTTNNRMELAAAIESLITVEKHDGDVLIYSDSTYVVSGITVWVKGWMLRGWKTADKKDVLNQDLWQRLYLLASQREKIGKLEWKRVPGHAGVLGNERADVIATSYASGKDFNLAHGLLEEYEKIFEGKLIL